MPPRVTVLLPVYNAAAFLPAAIASLQTQTFGDFSVLAIDDGSTDESGAILDAVTDPRWTIIHQPNAGLVTTLNAALDRALATGAEFIARMDADDIALPERFARQVAFLDAHADSAGCGTWIESFDVRGPVRVWQHPTDPDHLAAAVLFRNPIAHPSVMLRRSVFASGLRYDPTARHCEDWALWATLTQTHRLANVPEVLLRYRVHTEQVCTVHSTEQRKNLEAIFRRVLARMGLNPTAEEMRIHYRLAFDAMDPTPEFRTAAQAWLDKIEQANGATQVLPHASLVKILASRRRAAFGVQPKG